MSVFKPALTKHIKAWKGSLGVSCYDLIKSTSGHPYMFYEKGLKNFVFTSNTLH